MTKTVQESMFRSGIAARLAGIPVETLRVWERRYQVSGQKDPVASQRLYTKADIQRLALIKRLVDLGQSIGTIANMDVQALEAVQATLISPEDQPGIATPNAHPDVCVGLIGSILGSTPIREAMGSRGVNVGFCGTSLISANPAPPITLGVDALLIEVPTLLEENVAEIARFTAEQAIGKTILFYRFAPNTLIRKLRLAGFAVVRMPFDAQELVSLCLRILNHRQAKHPEQPATNPQELTPPRFSTETLLQLAQLKSSVYCECPSQLADLLLNVTAFEQYSAQCANKSPEDAKLHKRLEHDAAKARLLLEAAMAELIRHEQLPFDQDSV